MITEFKTSRNVEIFIGPPASGKSSHSVKFAQESNADLIRGRDIAGNLALTHEGNRTLVPDDFFLPALRSILLLRNTDLKNIVFDNVPRTKAQAEFITSWTEENGAELRTIVLALDKNEVIRRFLDRTSCVECGTSYHPDVNPENILGQCNKDGQLLVRRIGDKVENVEHAYSLYQNMAAEIIPVLEKKGSLYQVSALGTVAETYDRLRMAVEDNKIPENKAS